MKYVFLLFVNAAIILSACSNKEYADRIYYNAVIWTGDSSNALAEAIALKDSMILYVGNDYAHLKGNSTELIDAGGKLIIPGFIDNHTHFLSGGYQLANVDLRVVDNQPLFISTLRNFAASQPEGRWIQGGDWDHEAWGGHLPHKKWIDSVTPHHPVLVNRYDGHMALANSAALKLAGIDKNTKNPEGGEIVRDPRTGEPTGVLKDEAMSLVYAVIPPMSASELDESLQRAVQEAHRLGITQVHDMGSYGGFTDLETYRRARRNDQLKLRIYSFMPLGAWAKLDSLINRDGRGDNLLFWGGVKGFVDGSLGSTTAWFYTPYLDDPSSSGFTVTDTATLRSWIHDADAAGLQLAVHAIGDRANDWLLKTMGTLADSGELHKKRFRVEHAQHLSPDALRRFGSTGIIPSVQPYHAIDDGRWAHKRLDTERLKGTYPFRSLLDHGARMTFGSDWTVAPLSPLSGIYAAITRSTIDNKNPDGWFPEQRISVEDALKCYTVNNAYAGFMDSKTGMLKAGYLADFCLLSENILTIPPSRIPEVTVIKTILNGQEVYRSAQ